jgi:N-acetylmuramoyl-L-alanine amidase
MSLRRIVVIGVLGSALVAPVARAADSAQDLYREALAKERALRAAANPSPGEWMSAIREYEAVVRRFPTSGYSDNALWQAAGLARDLFAETGDVREKDRAAKLLRSLVSEYPSSKLVPAAVLEITSLAGTGLGAAALPPKAAAAATTTSPPPDSKPVAASPALLTHPTPVLVRAINRVVLPEVVRIIIELDGEVSFHHERIDNPTRVFADLQGTQATPALRNTVLTYKDDIVRQVRIGRHPENTTRVVLDLHNLASYSLFTLYEPFRLVIDCERAPFVAVASPRTAEVASPTILPATPHPWLASTGSTPVIPSVAIPSARLPDAAPGAPAPQPRRGDPASGAAADVEPLGLVEATPIPTAALPAPLPPSANARGGFSLARQLGLGVSRIVIDPGHGGHDPGALKTSLSEAELVLDIAIRLEQLLLGQPSFEVVLTRRTDSYVPLEERTAIANREGADLFLSIHANAARNAKARGVETYVLNFAATAEAAAVAARENSGSGRTLSSLADIVRAIALSSKREESRDFAAIVQRALFRELRTVGMRDLGVKQAPFMVLIGAEMPSILAEIAFLTNRQDQQLLKQSSYRQRIAEALLSGILRYQQTLKSNAAKLAQQ